MKKHNPGDRRDNVEKIQEHIDNTIENINLTEETIEVSDDERTRQNLKAKNKKREEALDGMRQEIKDEAGDRQNKYK